MPQSATAQINIRYNVLQSEEDLIKLINNIINEELSDTDYKSKTEFKNSAQPFLTKKSDTTLNYNN